MQTVRPEIGPSSYGRRLREERKRLGLTQSELASRAGVSKTSVVNYEGDVYIPDINFLAMVASCGMDALYILTGETERSRAVELINWGLLGQLLTLIDEWSSKLKKVKATPEAKVELLRLFYHQFRSSDRNLDQEALKRSFKLIAGGTE